MTKYIILIASLLSAYQAQAFSLKSLYAPFAAEQEEEIISKEYEVAPECSITVDALDSDILINYSAKFDEHAPSIIRVNAPFSHMDEYYEIFNVEPEHQNYLEENLRTRFLDI